jgi:hypothetical protein
MARNVRPPPRPALKRWTTAWLPTAILVAGLSAAIAGVAGSDAIRESLPTFRLHFGLFAVGDWGALDPTPYSPFLEHRLAPRTVGLTIMYLISTCALGSIVVERIRGDDQWPWAVSALAAFLPGYLITLAPLQMLFAAVPADTAAWIAVFAVPASAIVVQRRSIARGIRAVGHVHAGLRSSLPAVLGVTSLLGLTVVHRIQVERAFLVPDSIFYFLAGIDGQRQEQFGSYLVQWKQQSDEWLFSAPLALTTPSRDFELPFYATQVISVAAFVCLAYGLGRRFARRRHSAAGIAATTMALAGTSVIYPWIYITIAAGNSPVLASGQPGRHIGTLAPWATLLLLRRHPPAVLAALAVMALGLGFTSLQVAASVAVTIAVALGFRLLRQSALRRQHRFAAAARTRGVTVAIAALPPALIIATFCWPCRPSSSSRHVTSVFWFQPPPRC